MISTLALTADPPPPDNGFPRIPGYTVSRLLGRGGMGCVYLATDVRLNREVAVKTLLVDDPDLAARFREEVAAVAAVRHPNVLHVYQAGDADGRPYYVMEYVPGGTLAADLDGRPMAPRAAAGLLEPIARAVHHCHGLGILHRDLKPGNILLSAECGVRSAELETLPTVDHSALRTPHSALVPKVADFGLAKRLHGDAKLTRTGDVLGTPAYMAPEQASGVVSQLGPGADIYALGAILYEMLTGRPPFQSPDPMQTLMMVLSMDPLPPRRLLPAIPRDLETICLRCLQKTPKRRYASAGDLADDLRRYLDGRPIQARPARAWEKAVKWARRRPAAAGLVGLGVVAVAALVAGFVVIRGKNAELRQVNDRLEWSNGQQARALQFSLGAISRLLVELSQELASVPQAETARRNVLRDAEELCRKLMASDAGDPAGRHLAAKARFYLADVYRLQGRPADALAGATAARDALTALAAEAPDRADWRLDAVGARNLVGQLLASGGDAAGAEAEYRAALAAGAGLPGDDPATAQALGRVRNNLAQAYARLDRPDLAEAEHRALLADRLKALAEAPADDDRKRDVAATRMNLANLTRGRKEYAATVAELEAAEGLYLSMPRPRPADRDNLGKVRLNLESAAQAAGRGDVRGRAAAAAAETFAGLATDFPSAPGYRARHAYARLRLGFWHDANGRGPVALENFATARTILLHLTREYPDDAEYREQLDLCRRLLGEK